MKRTFIQAKEFSKQWDFLGFTDNDLKMLENIILEHPKSGAVIKGTGGLRKLRFSREKSGKSGGVRICYIDLEMEEIVYFITVYPKNKKDNLSFSERNSIKKMIDGIKGAYKGE